VPLDFAEEILPAEALVADKTGDAEEIEEGAEDPFVEGGLFHKRPGRWRRFPLIRQIDEMDCGAASLAMVCGHFGRTVKLSRIRALCHTASDGTSLKAIAVGPSLLVFQDQSKQQEFMRRWRRELGLSK